VGFIILFAAVLSVRLAYVQVVKREHYIQAAGQFYRPDDPAAVRPGRILDRDRRVLADAAPSADVILDPWILSRSDEVASSVAFLIERLGIEPDRMEQMLGSDSRYERLARNMPLRDAEEIAAADIPGLYLQRGYYRYYPYGKLAAHTLGAYSRDQRPLSGLDYKYAFVIQGQPGTPRSNVDIYGRTIVGSEDEAVLAPVPGRDLVTTIDLEAQRATENALDQLWEKNKPEMAAAVVMDPHSGEVLAMSSRPTYDPNGSLSPELMRNLPVQMGYEPGSTFKAITVAAALEKNAIGLNDWFHCDGTREVGGRPLRCWGHWAIEGHGDLDAQGVLANSCNLGAAQIAQRLVAKVGREGYVDYLHQLGFGEQTEVGLGGELAGNIYPAESLRVRDIANMSFGQHMQVTPIQLTAALSALVNGGIYMQPRLVRGVLNTDGTEYYEVPAIEKRRVCSPETSAVLRELLTGVVDEGTGRTARIEGVAVGGKTGTAQVWDRETGTYPEGQKIVSFALVTPTDRLPEYVILVLAKNPQIGEHGSDVAGPAARAIAMELLRNSGILDWATSDREDDS
jgi:stage V sporulation protein D (sporulation-specific penicillin-binding protein)